MTTTKAPKMKPFTRKPWDDGERVEWDGDQWGIVWSQGPLAASVWVAVEGDTTRMVAVKKPTKTRGARQLPA